VKREFEVNVFGAMSVTNAFLPALRKARGRIVQISTWTASLAAPVQRTIRRIEGRDGGVCNRLPRRTEAVRHRCCGGAAGNMKTGGPEKTAAALARVADGMTLNNASCMDKPLNRSQPLSMACRTAVLIQPPPPEE